jgi:hypothetical protein
MSSSTIETARSVQFRSTIDLLLQQKVSKFQPHVTQETFKGKRGTFDRIRPTEMTAYTGRHSDTPLIPTEHDRRHIVGQMWVWSDLIDDEDRLQMLGDPTSSYVQNVVASINRKTDAVIRDAFFAAALTGEEAGSTVSFPAGNIVAAGGVGLSYDKIIAAKKILIANEVDLDAEKPILAVTDDQWEELMTDNDVINNDFSRLAMVQNGDVMEVAGVRIVKYQGLSTASAGVRACPLWVPSGMMLGVWKSPETRVTEMPTKNYNTQVYARMRIGATRMEEGKVIQINCTE